jgi:hypothetical protein
MKSDNFSVFSSDYEKLFEKNFTDFRNNMQNKDEYYLNEKYCLFFPSCGNRDKGKINFIIYGQAPAGWTPTFKVSELISIPILVKDAIEFSNTINEDEKCPIDWVNKSWGNKTYCGYNPAPTFFWNTTYKLINKYCGYDPNSENWVYNLIWSNLMKIAPTTRRSKNPDDIEWQAQLEFSKQLFLMELEEIKPKYAILLTNSGWADDFVNKIDISRNQNGMIESIGNYNGTKIIVTKRPYLKGKKDEECVSDILKML